MPEQNKPFVVTDRRKFTKEGELRPDAPPSEKPAAPAAAAPPPPPTPPPSTPPATLFQTAQSTPGPTEIDQLDPSLDPLDEDSLPAPTPEQNEQARFAYEQTADRLDVAIRSANPGADHPPAMNFDQLVQSLYLTGIMQLGGATPEGEKPRVDILGARQSIDMLAVVSNRTQGNLSPQETKLIDSALFELRMAFLEITQALARSAATQGPKPGPSAAVRPGSAAPGSSGSKSGLIF